MAGRGRSEGVVRVRGRRVYSNRIEAPSNTPLQTLLHLVALKAERDQASANDSHLSDEDLREVVSALYQVATGNFDAEQVLALATRRACSMTGATSAAIALRQGESFICRSSLGTHAPSLGASFSAESGISGQCVQTGQILVCQDTELDLRVNALVCRQLSIRSMVAVPVFKSGAVCGILEVFADRPQAFHDADTYLLQLISSLVGHSVQERLSAPTAQREVPKSSDDRAKETPPADIAVGVKNWADQSKPSIPTANFRVAAGFAASAVLFAAIWFAIPRTTYRPSPISSPVQEPAVVPRAPEAQEASTIAEINGIEFKSHGQFTAIRIAAARPVKHQSGRLQHPERIYFDLFDSDLAPSFGGNKGAVIEVNDPYVSRIRAVQTSGHDTRIVLDLKCACDYTAVSPDKPPYGLSILVQPPHKSSQRGVPASIDAKLAQPAAAVATISDGVLHTSSAKLTVVIDAGHGGADFGTVGPDGLAEKDLVLDIAHRLGTLLARRPGTNVVFTRADDRFLSLERRDQIANEAHADLLVSIHANSSTDRLTRGVETYYHTGGAGTTARRSPTLQPISLTTQGTETRTLAGLIQRELYAALSGKDKGLRNRGVKEAQFVLLMNAGMPAVLTEVAFISSPSDERSLSHPETRQVIANGLFQGISAFIKRQSPASGL